MANQGRTPIPKSQYEISTGNINPYDTQRGNPNSNRDLNRGDKVSFKGDTTKPFNVGFKDIDESLVYYFDKVIQPFVIQNGQRIEVPVIYGNPERWKSVQKDGFYRDQKGKIMAPIIMFKRNTITPIKGLYNKLDANHPLNVVYTSKNYTKQNSYDKFNILNNRKPVTEQYAIVVPEYVDITYNCVVYTYYVEQLNKLLESINYASNSYWGDTNRFKFRASIDSYSTPVELPAGDIRTVKATFDIKLMGYIIPDVMQKDLTVDKKRITTGQLIVKNETVTNADGLNQTPNYPTDTKFTDTDNF